MTHHTQPANPPPGGYHRPGPGWEPEQQRWGPDAGWDRGNGTGHSGTGTQDWNRNPPPPNPRVELYPMQTQHRTDFPPLAPPMARPTYAQQFQPARRNDQWDSRRNTSEEPINPHPNGPPGGPVRNNPRQQNPRGSTARPQSNPPYEKPAAKPPVYRQSVMPYFTTVQGEFTQLCVNTAQEKPCTEPGCKFSHVPKTERPCPAFHTPKEKCPFDARCLLGHAEAREAVRQSKAFARHKDWQTQVKTTPGTYGETHAAESGTGKANPPKPPEAVNTAPNHASVTPVQQNPAVPVNPTPTANPANPVNAPQGKPNPTEPTPGTNPPVNFQTLVQENNRQGHEDEMRRLALLTQGLQTDMEKLKQTQQEKDDQMRSLQTAMGTLQAANQTLQEENESKLSLLDSYYQTIFAQSSKARLLLDLNISAPSEKALEGLLVIIATMYCRPRELDGNHTILDLFESRPITRFSAEVSSLQSLGLNRRNDEHAFFLTCYMHFPVDSSFVTNGVVTHASAVVSLPPGGACPPRASVLKKAPKRFRKLFFSQSESRSVTTVPNSDLNLSQTGGLSQRETLPPQIHHLITRFSYQETYKNPNVPLISQFVMFKQNELHQLDSCLLKYQSPVYKSYPLKLREYKNGRSEVVKNTDHPAYDKWESLINRVHFDPAYATTRLTFGWKGFYLPKGKISSQRDKYAFFTFAYVTDLFLGALPLWPLDASSQFQLDRKDPLRHYTIDNVSMV